MNGKIALIGLGAIVAGFAIAGIDSCMYGTMDPVTFGQEAWYHITGPYHSVLKPLELIIDNARYLGALGKVGAGASVGGLAAIITSPFVKEEKKEVKKSE